MTEPTEPIAPAAPPPGAPPAAPPPGGPPPASPPPGPARRPNLWRQATSTTGGLVAVIVAACLVALLVLGLFGTAVFVAARTVAGHDHEAGSPHVSALRNGNGPPGQHKKLDRAPGGGNAMPRGPGPMGRNGNGAPGQLWLFWVAPIIGGLIAGATFHFITGEDKSAMDIDGTTNDLRNAELDDAGRPVLDS